jgi:hypothetical protein
LRKITEEGNENLTRKIFANLELTTAGDISRRQDQNLAGGEHRLGERVILSLPRLRDAGLGSGQPIHQGGQGGLPLPHALIAPADQNTASGAISLAAIYAAPSS